MLHSMNDDRYSYTTSRTMRYLAMPEFPIRSFSAPVFPTVCCIWWLECLSFLAFAADVLFLSDMLACQHLRLRFRFNSTLIVSFFLFKGVYDLINGALLAPSSLYCTSFPLANSNLRSNNTCAVVSTYEIAEDHNCPEAVMRCWKKAM